ncbi:MAG: AAA family ATPase, partial [Anaerolineales bacterium]|nr:AAA family ATPase [Anaerolineales bacterium]
QDTNDPAGTLRWHLSQIRRRVAKEIISTDRQETSFNFGAATVDVHQFQMTLTEPETESLARLEKTVNLYRDNFLADLELPDSPEYELWRLGERARYAQLYEKGGTVLVERYIERGAFAAARTLAQKLLQSNPLLEQLHRYLIWLYAEGGLYEAAQRQYELCQKLLWQELAVQPAPETTALAAAIADEAVPPPLGLALPASASQVQSSLGSAVMANDFVGRKTELQHLDHAWERLAAGKISTVLVTAMAGGGKSRFLAEFARRKLPAGSLLEGICYESTSQIPFLPWLAVLEPLAANLAPANRQEIPAAWQRQLARLLPAQFQDAEPAAEKQDFLFRAIATLLEIAIAGTPRLLFFDDLQWADSSSLQLFCFIAAEMRRRQCPVMLVGSYRAEEAADNEALLAAVRDIQGQERTSLIQLPPFTAVETAQLQAQMSERDEPLSAKDAAALHAATGGNPLFLVELIRAGLDGDKPAGAQQVPPSLQALTERRLKRLTNDSRQVLETLAILDRPPSFELLQRVSGRSEHETLNALEAGLQWQFLTHHEADQYRFAHDLVATAVRAQLSQVRLQRLHRRAAVTLEQLHAGEAIIAYHWRMAGNSERESHYTYLAAQAALNQGAYHDATVLFSRVLELLPETAARQRAEALLGLVRGIRVTEGGNRWQETLADLIRETELLGWPDLSAAAALQQAEYLQHIGENQEALAVAEQGLHAALAARDNKLRARLILIMGHCARNLGQYEIARTYAEQAAAVLEQYEDLSGLAIVTSLRAELAQFQGQPREAIRLFKEALAQFRRLGDPLNESHTLNRLSNALYAVDETVEGREILDAGLRISQQLGDEMGAAGQYNGIAGTLINKGDYEGALEHYQMALAIARRHQHKLAIAVCLSNIAAALMPLGRIAEAMPLVDESLELTVTANLPRWEAFALQTKALCHFDLQEYASARELLLKAYEIRKVLGEDNLTYSTVANLILIDAHLGELAEGERFIEIAEQLADSLGANLPSFSAQRFHFAVYHLRTALDDESRARIHIFKAHEIAQARLADPRKGGSSASHLNAEIQAIRDIVARLQS